MKNCTSCEKEIADFAGRCPHCGQSFTTPVGWLLIIVAAALGAVFIAAILGG